MNATQRRLHSLRSRQGPPVLELPELARAARPRACGGRVEFPIKRGELRGRVSLPARPRGWLVNAAAHPLAPPEGYATLTVDCPEAPQAEALIAALRWLRSLPENAGLEIAIAGGDEALAAAARLGPACAAVVLDRPATGPLVLCPVIQVDELECGLEEALDAEFGSRAPALNHAQRRRVARGLRRSLRRRGRVRAAVAALAGALAFMFSLALSAPGQATVTPTYLDSGDSIGHLTVASDAAADAITVECTNSFQVEVNGAVVPGDLPGSPTVDPGETNLNCHEVFVLVVSGAGGADTIDVSDVANDGDATVDDFTNLTGGDVSLEGGNGADSIVGTNDIRGELAGGGASDTLQGSAFAGDSLRGGADDDSIVGAGGSDTLDYSGAAGPVDVNLLTGNATGQGTDTVSGENAIGTGADDSLVAGTAISSLIGGGGGDTLSGSPGADTLLGEAGTDSANGAAGNDSLLGGTENDTLDGGIGTDLLDGEAGGDFASFATAASPGVSVNLATESVSGSESDTIDEIEGVIGSSFADTLTGGSTADTLLGSSGGDQLDGGTGNDSLNGEGNADFVNGLNGADTVIGGGDDDTLQGDQHPSLGGGLGSDSINGGSQGAAGDLLLGYAGLSASSIVLTSTQANYFGTSDALADVERASLTGDGDDNLLGGSDNSNLGTEFAGPITVDGAGGNDTLRSGAGDDSLIGGTGNNQVQQLADADQTVTSTQLTGLGTDTLSGITEASLKGASDDDLLDGTAMAGPVTLDGGSGGDDSLLGGSAGDWLRGLGGIDSLEGNSGDDLLAPRNTGALGATQTVSGGNGSDTLDYSDMAGPVEIDLNAGITDHDNSTDVDELDDVENAIGTADVAPGAGDTMTASVGTDLLVGGVGVDNASDLIVQGIDGDAGMTLSDTHLVFGAAGWDLEGFEEASLMAGAGDNMLNAAAFSGPVTIDAGAGMDTVHGGAQTDTLSGGADTDVLTQVANVDQTLTDTQLTGMGTDQHLAFERAVLVGGSGANTINASAFTSPVTLAGMAGSDTLRGGTADDLLQSDDRGTADSNDCGPGADTAEVDGADTSVNCETLDGPPGPPDPPDPPNPPDPPANDTRAPDLKLKGDKKQHKSKKVKVEISSDEGAEVELSGTIKVPKIKNGKKQGKKKLNLKRKTVELSANQTKTVNVKFSGKAKKLVRKALKADFKSNAKVIGEATDAAGNSETEKRKIKVKPKR